MSERESLLPALEICAGCGHLKTQHFGLGFQESGWRACMANVDARPVNAGGDTLVPCQCKGFVPLQGEVIA